MNYVSQLNTQGVRFLEQGHYKEATNAFRGSLNHLTTLVEGTPVKECTIIPECKSSAVRIVQKENYFFHAEAMAITTATATHVNNTDESLQIVSSIILFNMALGHHLHLCANPAKAAILSKKAMDFYRLSVESSRDLCQSTNDYCRRTSAFLSIAALNNMAHILHEVGLYEDSRLAFEQMNLRISYTQDCANDKYASFLLNSILLRRPDLAAAA